MHNWSGLGREYTETSLTLSFCRKILETHIPNLIFRLVAWCAVCTSVGWMNSRIC